MSDEKSTPDDNIVDPVVSAADAADTDAQSVQPTGKRRRKGAPERPVVEAPVETEEKDTKDGFFSRAGRAIKAFFIRFGHFFKSVWDQMSKVVWPTKKQMLMSVLAVFIFLVITVALVFGVDTGAGELVRVIFQNPNGGADMVPPGMPGMPGM
ncbi:preprotein translocase subunit SecE [Lawsonella clevelandensis]|uniref:preprotein translocase subunit SecE n=1 Tax=Lawsonella clevelandensis TaxID=1528099 RepID=UPI0006B5AF2C|nr:preprotein translocase subunit SecE [Lawsonella clevelandensis]